MSYVLKELGPRAPLRTAGGLQGRRARRREREREERGPEEGGVGVLGVRGSQEGDSLESRRLLRRPFLLKRTGKGA
jgi:hypothetical protein